MATSVPKTNWQGVNRPVPTNAASRDVVLTYDGKQPESAILATPAANIEPVWGGTESLASSNRLYYGNNLPILARLLGDPSLRGQIRLIYIDPPFATNGVFHSRNGEDAYQDLLAGAHYIEFLRERLILLRELLSDDGSIYVHLDENMAFHIKMVMDEVFGRGNYRNWITRKKCNPKNYTKNVYGNVSDFILFYTKSDRYVWNRPVDPWSAEAATREYNNVEPETGRRYKKVPVHAPGVRRGATGQPWRGKLPPPGKHWQYPPDTLEAMDARGEIYWSPTGNPRRKIYLDESDGIPVQDLWLDMRDAHNQNIAVTGYPTEKNPDLLDRIVAASSNPGDWVLDAFAGSGTTLAAAHRASRRWIGIDNSPQAIQATLRRFAHGPVRMGDFVRDHAAPVEQSPISMFPMSDGPRQGILPLFSAAGIYTVTRVVEPIRNFTLLAEAGCRHDLDPILQEWQESAR